MNFQKLLPPVWFLLSIIVMTGLHLWLPVQQLFFPPITYLGIVAIAIGIVIVLFCDYLFRQKNTTIKPFQESSYLVREGIFKYSRNPIYLGMTITLIGLWIGSIPFLPITLSIMLWNPSIIVSLLDGFAKMGCSLWIFLGSLTPVFIIPVFAWLIQELFIKEEERMLEAKFGESYQEYKATVRRWI